jgi:hypothetical protein
MVGLAVAVLEMGHLETEGQGTHHLYLHHKGIMVVMALLLHQIMAPVGVAGQMQALEQAALEHLQQAVMAALERLVL